MPFAWWHPPAILLLDAFAFLLGFSLKNFYCSHCPLFFVYFAFGYFLLTQPMSLSSISLPGSRINKASLTDSQSLSRVYSYAFILKPNFNLFIHCWHPILCSITSKASVISVSLLHYAVEFKLSPNICNLKPDIMIILI